MRLVGQGLGPMPLSDFAARVAVRCSKTFELPGSIDGTVYSVANFGFFDGSWEMAGLADLGGKKAFVTLKRKAECCP